MALSFEPDQLAYYEKAGRETYYDRNWLRASWLLVRLNHAQVRMAWPVAFSAAVDTVRASERMRASAELRARAAEAVDLIASGRSTDVPADWLRVEEYLQQAYRAVLGKAISGLADGLASGRKHMLTQRKVYCLDQEA